MSEAEENDTTIETLQLLPLTEPTWAVFEWDDLGMASIPLIGWALVRLHHADGSCETDIVGLLYYELEDGIQFAPAGTGFVGYSSSPIDDEDSDDGDDSNETEPEGPRFPELTKARCYLN